MKRVLLICVGTRDPYTQRDDEKREGPILSFHQYLKDVPKYNKKYMPIQAVYLLSTMEKLGSVNPTQKNAEDTKKILEKRGWRVYHRPLDVLDPTDYHELVPAMMEVLLSILQEQGSQCEYLINVSPGTGQMEAVWISLYIAGLLPKAVLLQVKAPWDEPDIKKRVREVAVVPLRDPMNFVNATKHINTHRLSSVGLYCSRGRIWVDGREVTNLSKYQRKLILLLWKKSGEVCTYSEIAEKVYEDEIYTEVDNDRPKIRQLVKRTRIKIEPDWKNPRYIRTIRGEGFMLLPKG